MKYLIFLALIIPSGIYGQELLLSPNFSMVNGKTTISETLKYDTIPCIMLVTDTNHIGWEGDAKNRYCPILINYDNQKITGGFCGGFVLAIRGYEVSYKDWLRNTDNSIFNAQTVRLHDTYLNDKKQPLKLFVWMSKEIKQ